MDMRCDLINAAAMLSFIAVLTVCCGNNPLESGDETLSAEIAAQGFDPAGLAAAENRAAQITYLQSLLIIRNGTIVSEHYYHGTNRSTAFNIYSVSKSYLSALVGIALQEGHIESLDQTVHEFFPEYFQSGDVQKRRITIRHLLTMTPGLDWYELGPIAESWLASRDWIKFFIDLPLARTPGNFFNYSTAGTHVLSAILTKAAGMSLMEFAENKLFRPGSMTVLRWDRDYQGYYYGGWGMYFTVRDMAKLGEIYLNGGAYGGKQIVPAGWVQESTRKQVNVTIDWFLDRGVNSYGYLWWQMNSGGYTVFFAWGHAGQFVFVVPDLELVVAITSSEQSTVTESTWLNHEKSVFSLLENYIIPAANSER